VSRVTISTAKGERPERSAVFMGNPSKDRFYHIKYIILEIFVILSMLFTVARFLISEIKSLFSLF
jgi:hypothetical protein